MLNSLIFLLTYFKFLDIVHCTAIDSIGDRLVGCNSVIDGDEIPMLRPSSRVPYIILCEVHLNRMLRHNCCPKCGLFCTQVNNYL